MTSPPSSNSLKRLIPLREGRPLLIATGLLLTLCTALLFIFQPQFIKQTELHLYDTMLAGRMSPPKTAVPVMVGIDDESLEAYGQWPWPRYRLAQLVQRLREMGADVIALDFLMPEADRTSPEVIMAERRRDLHASSKPERYDLKDSNTKRLADALAGGNTILGYYFEFSGTENNGTPKSPVLPEGMVVTGATASDVSWPRPARMLRSVQELSAATSAEGFTNSQHDLDGVLRRAPLLLRYHGQYYPSLSLGAILLASPDRSLRLVNDGTESALIWGKRQIPIDRNGNLMIDFRRGKKSFPYLSAKEVLSSPPLTGSLRGKIVLVGAWARGLEDIHQVPLGQSLNGLEVHATIIDNILSGTYISRPDWARGAELFAILLLGVLSTWLLSQSGFLLSLLAVVVSTGGCYLGGKELLLSSGLFVSPLFPMVTPIIVMSILSLLKYGIEARKVLQRNSDLLEAQDSIISSLSALAETRDEETGGHILRTKYYVETLARQLATSPNYPSRSAINVDLLAKSALLHDIGKVGIPDHILLKPGPLTEEEFTIIKTHTLIGAKAITKAIAGSAHPESLDFLHIALQMVESHHEKWDGSGYPKGLSGTDIPLSGRLMALADAYDAIVSKRVYKRVFSHAEAKEFILKDSGSHFDPDVVAAFVAKNEEFIQISRKFADECFLTQKTASLTAMRPDPVIHNG